MTSVEMGVTPLCDNVTDWPAGVVCQRNEGHNGMHNASARGVSVSWPNVPGVPSTLCVICTMPVGAFAHDWRGGKAHGVCIIEEGRS